MEVLSWMKKVDMTMDKLDLLELIDQMHEVINAILIENDNNKNIIVELKNELERTNL